MTVVYRRGEDNPAHYISRHSAKQTTITSRQEKVAEDLVNYIAQTSSTPNALNLHDIESATERDPTLQAVAEAMRTGNWFEQAKRLDINTAAYKAIKRVKEELTVCTTFTIVLRVTRIVIPCSNAW